MELERENEQLRELNTSLHEEIEEWKSNYANLEEEKRVMFQEMQAEIRTLQNDVEKAETTNKELLDYIELIQRAQQDYKGTHIYDGGSVATFLYWPRAPLASPGASIKKLPQNAPSYMCVRLKHRLLFVT